MSRGYVTAPQMDLISFRSLHASIERTESMERLERLQEAQAIAAATHGEVKPLNRLLKDVVSEVSPKPKDDQARFLMKYGKGI